jgi:hypothetical protein
MTLKGVPVGQALSLEAQVRQAESLTYFLAGVVGMASPTYWQVARESTKRTHEGPDRRENLDRRNRLIVASTRGAHESTKQSHAYRSRRDCADRSDVAAFS